MTSCGNNNSPGEKQQANNPSSEKKAEPATNSSAQGDGIVGEWEMVGPVIDINDYLQIDEVERKNLKQTMKEYIKLNSNGSGVFKVARLEGRYEAKAKESNGKKYLTWYDSANDPHRVGTIISVTQDELHIKETGGSGLFIWKRL